MNLEQASEQFPNMDGCVVNMPVWDRNNHDICTFAALLAHNSFVVVFSEEGSVRAVNTKSGLTISGTTAAGFLFTAMILEASIYPTLMSAKFHAQSWAIAAENVELEKILHKCANNNSSTVGVHNLLLTACMRGCKFSELMLPPIDEKGDPTYPHGVCARFFNKPGIPWNIIPVQKTEEVQSVREQETHASISGESK